MLAQLICVDRRYQRMNCFNIREVQALLKQRFFADLVENEDHRDLLSSTMIGARFKTGHRFLLDPNAIFFSALPIQLTTRQRLVNFLLNSPVQNLASNSDSLFFALVGGTAG